nr:hypothetical protein [Tanacetum cinerariifolium]
MFTKLSLVVRLLDLKAKNNWSDRSFTTLLELLHEAFPEDNELPVTMYHAKKLTCPMGLAVERIHACRNDFILYIKDYKVLHECPVCKASRYKHHKNLTELDSDVTKNGPPAKMLWYLPIIPRLKKLYANPKDAKLLRWYAEERPKQPGNDIDVYLRPLIDDMIDLWETCIEIYDAYKKERFQLFAMIYCTINDFPAYGLLLNILGKTKDGVNAQKDMLAMGIRSELTLQETNGKKIYFPPACYTLSKAEKTSFCECLHGIKVSSSYSANIKNLVSMKDLKLLGMKSHDCHVLLTQMIPIAIRGLMPPQVRQTITKLCLFFNMIHSKVLDHEKLEELQRDIILILCQLEMYFPPFFFDVMVYLVSHIVEEIKIAGVVFLRYMYPFKRLEGVGTIGRKDVTPNNEDLEQAHFTVLQNMTCIEPYIQEHMSSLAIKNGRREQRWLEAEHKKTFSQWFADKVIGMSPSNVDVDVIHIGYRPCRVLQYQGYDINRYTFYIKKQDDKSTVQNSGVTLIATTTDSSRMKIAKDSYYGVIEEIWELDYTTVVIPILKCKWVDNTILGVKVDNDGFTCVNLSTNGYLSYPFILAKQVDQVFYVEDPLDKRWHIVLQSKRSI